MSFIPNFNLRIKVRQNDFVFSRADLDLINWFLNIVKSQVLFVYYYDDQTDTTETDLQTNRSGERHNWQHNFFNFYIF